MYEVNDRTVKELDAFEDHPNYYVRKDVKVVKITDERDHYRQVCDKQDKEVELFTKRGQIQEELFNIGGKVELELSSKRGDLENGIELSIKEVQIEQSAVSTQRDHSESELCRKRHKNEMKPFSIGIQDDNYYYDDDDNGVIMCETYFLINSYKPELLKLKFLVEFEHNSGYIWPCDRHKIHKERNINTEEHMMWDILNKP